MAQEFWESAAQKDPLWAILSDPTKKGRRWTAKEFFETGRREISVLMYQLHQMKQVPRAGRALDFGCGVGRLSQALIPYFAEVVGVDVSPTMIRLAETFNTAPGRVRYVLNQADDLECFPSGSFDFIYSDIVLQHLPPDLAKTFVREFVRLLGAGGIVVFQLPSHERVAGEQSHSPLAMADQAYRAQLNVIEGMPARMNPSERAHVMVAVENVSDLVWDQSVSGSIRLGNHWLSQAGDMMVQDDGRQSLGTVIAPGGRAHVSLEIQAPADAGSYVCELDLVHEGVTWFGDRGSQTLRSSVLVSAGELDDAPGADAPGAANQSGVPPEGAPDFDLDAHLPAPTDFEIGEFPMSGVHHDRVLEILMDCGAPAFHVETDDRGFPEWHGYRYFAKRPG